MLKNLSAKKKAISLAVLWYALLGAASWAMSAYAGAISVPVEELLQRKPLSTLPLPLYIALVSLPLLRKIKQHAMAANMKIFTFLAKFFIVHHIASIVLLLILVVIYLF